MSYYRTVTRRHRSPMDNGELVTVALMTLIIIGFIFSNI